MFKPNVQSSLTCQYDDFANDLLDLEVDYSLPREKRDFLECSAPATCADVVNGVLLCAAHAGAMDALYAQEVARAKARAEEAKVRAAEAAAAKAAAKAVSDSLKDKADGKGDKLPS